MKNVQKNKLAGVVIEIHWCVQYFFSNTKAWTTVATHTKKKNNYS